MKKTHLTLVLLFAMAFAKAQVVSIPDINFKLKLLSASPTNQIAKNLAGNWTVIDTNNDGLIQQSEANNISYLNIKSTQTNIIVNYTGINNFNNLIELFVFGNVNSFVYNNKSSIQTIRFIGGTFSTVDVSNNPNLQILNFFGNNSWGAFDEIYPKINSINLSGCIGLKKFDFKSYCSLINFDGTGLVSLEELILIGVNSWELNNDYLYFINNEQSSPLSSVNLVDCVNLKKIDVRASNLSSLDLSNKINLIDVKLDFQFNFQYNPMYGENGIHYQPFYLNTNGCNNLKYISAKGINFTSNSTFNNLQNLEELRINGFITSVPTDLDISNCPNLKILDCGGYFYNPNPNNYTPPSYPSYIQSINLSNTNNIEYLNCKKNNITNLDLSNKIHLNTLICENNLLNNINLNNCISLSNMTIQNNQLTTLDLSSCGNLQSVNCDNNNLEYVSFKNNTNETKTFLNNLNLTYICADEAEQQSVQYIVNVYEMWDTCVVGDYCSFNPNGNYNTISGNALYDNENDGCDTNDEAFEFLRVNLSDGTNSGSTFTNFEGDYVFYGNAGTFTLTPQLENPTYFNVSPATTQISFTNANNNTASQDFCITPNGIHNDLEIVIAPTTPARPGFDAVYEIVYKNKGNQPLSGDIVFTFDDAKLDFVSASQMPTQATGSLTWSFTNLLPFENKNITLTLNANGPMETPAVNNGDVLTFNATISPITGDEIPEDNVFLLKQIVVGSFDPNDITCVEGEVVAPSQIGQFLHYVVRFENTGTAAAENVVVKTEINPAEFDMATLQALNASHNVYTRIKDNKVEFIFEDIQLAGSPAGGHGHVVFKIKSKSTLQTNDMVTNNANIFFDYNFPIETNDASTTFATLNNQNFTKDNSVKVYPNPAKETVTISAKTNLSSIAIYDAQGRIVQFVKANELEKSINISNLSNGIYILDIVSEKSRMVEKLVKE